ncbi:Asp-tRNA(Asn)/Glu-tRNA(Gln) amidotransferase subunit GatB [Algoriphagus sediminis]|uniref:Aspartyl/glutamyl-tRNA(Asn/Gln) amidotransferase subunit B n=1 Tax=Algoriphagus sediminis TaxID=3057113 RepID=A0ABT7YAW9_9BACT|nr:Asp-tRNA(Asn)/Glu-tRNA(Gln) amidotransferase subunit GatB [Algoriphagus sediminis]MDN3203550.1 Asp-tRNA(Asn)/Glu-tRNA(Gln) amidotransferase subunit GatB [Algoriphagus sediminis]
MSQQEILDKYQLVVGLEVHAQLATESKIFAGDSTAYGKEPNTQVSEITLGHPGTLPKVNKKAIEYAVRMGLACDCTISRVNIFDRKNYFYPDLPKGYQITQDKSPICIGGVVPIQLKNGSKRGIKLNRIHMEEDAGKSIHLTGESDTLVDFNRAGTPLIELVTEPDMHSAEEATAVLTELRKLVMYLGICDGNMEEGSFRCDANISVRPKGSSELGKKVEVKNMNSFRNVSKAINHEFIRQVELLEKGVEIISETRTFDADKGLTFGMRKKEELNDYRYFPEPDLSPIHLSEEWLEEVKSKLPPLPREYHRKFVESFGLPDYDAAFLTESKEVAEYFEKLCGHTSEYKAASNWMMGPVKSILNELGIGINRFTIEPSQIAELISLVKSGKVSFSAASQNIFPELVRNPDQSGLEIATKLNLIQESDESSLVPLAEQVIAENEKKVKEYRSGKKGLLGMFMGQLMKKSQGKADPKVAQKILTEILEK